MGEVLDMRGGAGHGEQSSQVGVGDVGGKRQSSALEIDTWLRAETLRRNTQRGFSKHGYYTLRVLSALEQFQMILALTS